MMSFKALSKFYFSILLVSISFFGLAQTKEKDPLNKRVFNMSLSEMKDGVAQKKLLKDVMEFKNGKLYSDLLNEKFGYKWIKYRIEKDSIFTDSTDTEVRYLEIEASATDETNQTVMISLKQLEWDLDGTYKITKNDKLKKHFEVTGREKGGKPKKDKKNPPDKMRMEGEEPPQKKE
ncbi:MAG: hypothetical protein SGJ15_09380 [Bacteroidota bacterium]|nr:hypothetical protein [Bacteroidota bacterium]